MKHHRQPAWAIAVLMTAALGACGGGNNSVVGGNLSGLASGATVVLQDNSSDNLSLSANGPFDFATKLTNSTAYAVTVLTQPNGQACTVENGSGTINDSGGSVDTVSVTCVSMATVQGSLSGLPAGTAVTLSNGDVLLPVAINGSFAFPGLLAVGSTYNISVATQPLGTTCTVSNGSGAVTAGIVVNVNVVCSS